MKKRKERRNIYGRKYTTFGYCLHVVLTVVGTLSVLVLLGMTGTYEFQEMSDLTYTIGGLTCLTISGLCLFIHKRVFGG